MRFSDINTIFSSFSIKKKLLIINLAVTVTALFFAVVMAVIGEYVSKRDFITESLQVQANMVSNNTTAALIFNDEQGAEDILQAFAASSEVQVAIIFDTKGNTIASYIKQGADKHTGNIDLLHAYDNFIKPKSDSNQFNSQSKNTLFIAQNIIFENEIIGSLLIQADISRLYDDIINFLFYTASVALLGLALASLLLLKLRKSITRPLKQLSQLMDKVIKNNDYSIRANNTSTDEIGILSQGFNKMLAHIQINDEKLAHELSERYKAEEHLDKLAYYDVTTSLPNRHFFQEHLDGAVERAITKKQKMALFFLDLDNFKIVNDTLGHKTGDLLLKQASSRLSNVLRQNDYICRIGGDEFAIVIEDISTIDDISTIAKKCIESLSNPFVFDGNRFFIGVSIGISLCPDDAITANDLLVNADIAMYDAKIHGKNNYQFFNQEMNEAHCYRYQLETDLRHAVKQDQMELYYQPQVDSINGLLTGVEALIRWNHPDKGVIKPDKFIPIAEETGLIISLGEWLINTACQQGKQLVNSGLKKITVAINISTMQIRENTFIETVNNAITSSGLDPAYLEIELTESTLMDESTHVIDNINHLKRLGINISIDDFGTGFSSMNHLKIFPINKIKIDKSFISGLPQSNEDMSITRAIIAMAHGLDIRVVAEGVEHKDQADYLNNYDCDLFQGYYYAKPMPLNDLLELIKKQNPGNQLRLIKGGSDKHNK